MSYTILSSNQNGCLTFRANSRQTLITPSFLSTVTYQVLYAPTECIFVGENENGPFAALYLSVIALATEREEFGSDFVRRGEVYRAVANVKCEM